MPNPKRPDYSTPNMPGPDSLYMPGRAAKKKPEKPLRVIKTARDEESINRAARDGYRPLLRLVKPSKRIRNKFAVHQHKTTGEIAVSSDYRGGMDGEYETVIGWTDYYPYNFPSPFTAYLIPADIEVGERVILEDLIEDRIGRTWNQGDSYRLDSCEAVWDGSDLKLKYSSSRHVERCVG